MRRCDDDEEPLETEEEAEEKPRRGKHRQRTSATDPEDAESIKGFSREGKAVMESSTAFVARQLGTESKPQRGRSLNAFS